MYLLQRFDCPPDLFFGVGRSEREAQRTAVGRHCREEGGRDQYAVLPKDVAGPDDVGYGPYPHAHKREQTVVIHVETQLACPYYQPPS